MSRNQFEYYPTSAPNTATKIFNVSTSNTITVIVAEKDAFANTYKAVDAFIPTNNNYWKFLDYCKEYDEYAEISQLNLYRYPYAGLQVFTWDGQNNSTIQTGAAGPAPNVSQNNISVNYPEEISRYRMYVKESIVDTDIYNVTSISIPNYIIDAQGNIIVGTPTVQTIKTLKPLASITNLLPIQFA